MVGFHQPPSSIHFDDPIPKRHPLISFRKHQKMREGYRNDYLEALGAVYWAKKVVSKKKSKEVCNNPPSEDER